MRAKVKNNVPGVSRTKTLRRWQEIDDFRSTIDYAYPTGANNDEEWWNIEEEVVTNLVYTKTF